MLHLKRNRLKMEPYFEAHSKNCILYAADTTLFVSEVKLKFQTFITLLYVSEGSLKIVCVSNYTHCPSLIYKINKQTRAAVKKV